MEKTEFLILRNLLYNEEYVRKVLPFIKSEYFSDHDQKIIFDEIASFVSKYNDLITKEALLIEIERRTDLNESTYKKVIENIGNFDDSSVELKWLIDTTERWCKQRAISNAISESIMIAGGKNSEKNEDAIPGILSDALSVSFNINVGHDYILDFNDRFESYRRKESKIPFDLEYFNKITGGGISPKTLNIVLAGVNVGKSLCLCHFASAALLQGKNVLYITLEMAEEKIAERIDANLMNVNIQDIPSLSKSAFEKKINDISLKTKGTLIVKEYPTGAAHAGHFKSLLNELALKKSFCPDIIFIDYLNICASSRYKGNISNSYSYVKSIAEELRGLAVEYNVPIFSATQTTRSGFNSSDPDLTDTSESFGLPATADFLFALVSTDELESLNQIMVKQLKNRYSDKSVNKKFMLGIDRSKMRLYDVEQSAQQDLLDSNNDVQYNDEESELKNKFRRFVFHDKEN